MAYERKTITCKTCAKRKPATSEHFWSRSGKLRPDCIPCDLQNNKDSKVKSRLKKSALGYERDVSKKQRDSRHRIAIEHLMTHPCVDCGTDDILVLEFDHVRGEKVMTITEMCMKKRPLELIMQEIAKCDVRCANCHRRKTYQNMEFGRRGCKKPPMRIVMLQEALAAS